MTRNFLALAMACVLGGSAFAQVTGTVKLNGKPPELPPIDMSADPNCAKAHPTPVADPSIVAKSTGELANVIVYVKVNEGEELKGDLPKEPAVLDQKDCMYSPHVLPMMAGQKFIVKNSDPWIHNIHSLAQDNEAFNEAMPNVGEKTMEPQKEPELFKVKCDIHPWMAAYIRVFEHPYFAVTKEDGTYEIKGLKDGKYNLMAWHERFGESPVQKIEVKDGKATADFTFSPTTAMINDNVKLASTIVPGKSCCTMKRSEMK